MRLNKKGFTLIELLVVVLIIALLSAVAVPQYTKMVEKSRVTDAIVQLKALADAANRYYMAKDSYANINMTRSSSGLNLDISPAISKFFNITFTVDTDKKGMVLSAHRKQGENDTTRSDAAYTIDMTLKSGNIIKKGARCTDNPNERYGKDLCKHFALTGVE